MCFVREVGDVPDIATLLDRLYNGRLSARNRSMAILGSRKGLNSDTVCSFLGIDKKTYHKYLRTFETGSQDALFARKINTTRKFDNAAVRQAVFGLLHEPPSNYGINRTTWVMTDLTRILREKGQYACPDVIRKITKEGRLPMAQGAHRAHIVRPGVHREAQPCPVHPHGAWLGRSLLLDR